MLCTCIDLLALVTGSFCPTFSLSAPVNLPAAAHAVLPAVCRGRCLPPSAPAARQSCISSWLLSRITASSAAASLRVSPSNFLTSGALQDVILRLSSSCFLNKLIYFFVNRRCWCPSLPPREESARAGECYKDILPIASNMT